MADVRNRRLIYGRRQGHKLHPRQARLVRDMLPALRPDMAAQSMAGWFGGTHFDAYALEIGFGGGEHLAARAQENRKTGFIGCEPFINGVAKLLIAIEAAGLNNVRVHGDDARDILAALPDAVLSSVYLLYPDPWPKLRHHKRRFVNDENLRALFRVMQPGAILHIASDIPDYVSWSLMHLRRHGGFGRLSALRIGPRPFPAGPAHAMKPRRWLPGGCRPICALPAARKRNPAHCNLYLCIIGK